MENTTNTFSDGMLIDMHPLTIKNTLLTDALNGTFITYNGNETILQNDMGNTKILDSTTGNLMGLRDGFIPLGMKERGGILYIASYNPSTKLGLLGTIPSPVFNYNYLETPYNCNFRDVKLVDTNQSGNSILDATKYLSTPFLISDKRFQVGDLFIVSLNFDTKVKIKRKLLIKDLVVINAGN